MSSPRAQRPTALASFTPAMTATSRWPKSSWSAAAVVAMPWRVTRACAWRCRSVRVSDTGSSLVRDYRKTTYKTYLLAYLLVLGPIDLVIDQYRLAPGDQRAPARAC